MPEPLRNKIDRMGNEYSEEEGFRLSSVKSAVEWLKMKMKPEILFIKSKEKEVLLKRCNMLIDKAFEDVIK